MRECLKGERTKEVECVRRKEINREAGTEAAGDRERCDGSNCTLLSMLHAREKETVEKQDIVVSLIQI